MKTSEIIEMSLENLAYKELRQTPATGIAVYPLPKFDPVTWAKNYNNAYGPNYFIDVMGNVYSVLPDEYHGNGDVKEEDRNKLIVFKADTDEANESFKHLQSALAPTFNVKTKENDKVSDRADKTDHTERSEVSSSKK